MPVMIARVQDTPLDVAAHLAAVENPAAGAMASFVGRVRDNDPEAAGAVVALEYQAHPDAETILHRIATEAVADSGAFVAVSHRSGRLAVGDTAVVIAVASGHRGDAFDICRGVIEAIKVQLPVWKRQIEADGSTAWKGLGG